MKHRRPSEFVKIKKLSWGSRGFAALQPVRFELYFILFFKKLLDQSLLKLRTDYPRPRYWVRVRPNLWLTAISKNSRMGSGVGLGERLVQRLNPGRAFIEFQYIPSIWLKLFYSWLRFKLYFKIILISG